MESDFQELIEDAITRTALKPPAVFDVEAAAEQTVELFNGGAKAIERGYKHRFGPFARFGLRLDITVKSVRRVRDGEEDFVPERHIIVRPQFPGAWSRAIVLLGIAIFENRTFELRKPPDVPRQLTKSQLAELHRRRIMGGSLDSETETYPPEIWHWMKNLLLFMQIPKRAIEYQATSPDGWWRRKGRQRKAGQKAMSRLFDIQERLAREELEHDQRMKRLNSLPTAGGMVPPGWPTHRSRDGLHIPSTPHKRSFAKVYGDKGWKDPLPKGKVYRSGSHQDHRDAKLVGVHSVDQSKKLMTEKKFWPLFKDDRKPKK